MRALGGALTAGLAALALVLVGVWLAAVAHHQPGPGAPMLLGHLVAAAVAIALQRVADRRGDRVGLAASVGVLLVLALVGFLFWWV